MSKIMSRIGLVVLAIAVAAILAGQAELLGGQAPQDLGVKEGRFKPPSFTPNSVSSQASLYPDHPQRAYASIEPLRYSGTAAQAMQHLVDILKKSERIVIVQQDSHYVYAQSTTALMRYTDDVEFWLDEANSSIQVRSASRLGASDLGLNRQRIENIRAQFQKN